MEDVVENAYENAENTRPQFHMNCDGDPDKMSGCNLLRSVDLASVLRFNGSVESAAKTICEGRKPANSASYRECLHYLSNSVDNGLPNSGSSGCSDFSDSYCVTSDSEQEVRSCAYGNCPKPVKFFVGFDSDSNESDEFFTADECSDVSDKDNFSSLDEVELEDDEVDVTFSDELDCSFSVHRPVSRSQSWSESDGFSHRIHRHVIHQSRSESNVIEISKPIKCVRFHDNPEVHCIVAWNYAYRAARKGRWEIMAVARERFRKRIEEFEEACGHVFENEHRTKVYNCHNRGSGDSQ